MKLLDAVTDSQWEALVATAEALVKAPKPKRFKELELIIPYSSDVEIIDCDDDNDQDDDNDKEDDNEAFDSVKEAVDSEEEPMDEDVMEIDGVETDFGGEELEDDDIEA